MKTRYFKVVTNEDYFDIEKRIKNNLGVPNSLNYKEIKPMKKAIIIPIVCLAALVCTSVWKWNKIFEAQTKIQTQSELLKTQQQIIQTQEETIHLLESWIELSDPDYIIMYQRQCIHNWQWPTWAEEIEDGKPPLRCWSGCNW